MSDLHAWIECDVCEEPNRPREDGRCSSWRCEGSGSRKIHLTRELARDDQEPSMTTIAHNAALTAEERSAMAPNLQRLISDWEPIANGDPRPADPPPAPPGRLQGWANM